MAVEQLFAQWLALLGALWWPFVRALALLSATPVIGENMVPITIRVLLALVIAVVLLPVAEQPEAVEAFSLAAVVLTIEQVVIGVAIGLAFHLTMAVVMVLGYTVSSQMGLAMAVMNDPMNGTSSDVVSMLLYILSILVFFSIDGHLVVAGVLGKSFDAWPVGGGLDTLALQSVAFGAAWVFAAALLLAAPVIFSALVVQVGFGFLNRVAPSFNLFSLGFSLVTVFGLFMLTQIVRFIPDHYVRMTNQVLGMLGRYLGG
ncbi:flagellar biosynthetic protein FliR [Aromatoleum sp.]|uniref:flagellar biosynthetic protein FliR n=1 Tax=Aromatoleum sp. TaxID=2307007 RepID=UPI002FC8FD13